MRRRVSEAVLWVLFIIFAGGLWAVAENALPEGDASDSIVPEYPSVVQTFPMPNSNYRPMFLTPRST